MGAYAPAARVTVGEDENVLSLAFRLTNNIDHSWPENDGVECLTSTPRSTSVGDMILIGDVLYICGGIAFPEAPADLAGKFIEMALGDTAKSV